MSKQTCDGDAIGRVAGTADVLTEGQRQEALLKTGALESSIIISANFSSIYTDAQGVIQIFNVGSSHHFDPRVLAAFKKISAECEAIFEELRD